MAKIWQTYGTDAHAMTLELLEAMEAWRLVDAGARVALKPNLVLASRPEDGAVTHPGVLTGCIEHFRSHGVSDIEVIESSWVGDATMRAMRRAGYAEVLDRLDVPFFDLKRGRTRGVDTPIGTIDVCERALDCDLLVDLPVLKGHCQTRMTCALKNLKGCIPDHEKRRFHMLGLTRPIAALAAAIRPRLVVVDSICGDLSFEEGGTPVTTNRMYATCDPVLADAYGLSLMGLTFDEVPYVRLAERYGAGSASLAPTDVVSLTEPSSPSASAARGQGGHGGHRCAGSTVDGLTRHVHERGACSACYAALVRALYVSGVTDRDTFIGQGWQHASPNGLGIGRCCSGAATCVMGCPPSAAAIVDALRAMA